MGGWYEMSKQECIDVIDMINSLAPGRCTGTFMCNDSDWYTVITLNISCETYPLWWMLIMNFIINDMS